MVIAGQRSSDAAEDLTLDYAPPRLVRAQVDVDEDQRQLSTLGKERILVNGTNIGTMTEGKIEVVNYTTTIANGEQMTFTAVNFRIVEDHTHLSFNTVAGLGAHLEITVVVAGQVSKCPLKTALRCDTTADFQAALRAWLCGTAPCSGKAPFPPSRAQICRA